MKITLAGDSASSSVHQIAVIMSCFNRKKLTIAALDSLFLQRKSIAKQIKVYLVDDASYDGTSDAVNELFPEVQLIQGDGSLFWNGGMRLAFAAAIEHGYDQYLWFN